METNIARSSRLCALAATLALASACSPARARAESAPATAVLSNLTTLSRWAYPERGAAARRAPSAHARIVGHLRFLTPDGQAQPYLALRSRVVAGTTWIEVPLPGRPNGKLGWVTDDALGTLHVTHEHIRVDRETYRITLYRNTSAIWSTQIGVGRPSLPTPAGHFYVMEKLIAIDAPLYGPYALGTSAYAPTLSEWPGGGVVGIHGTNEPGLIPGRPSHGCIRLRNDAMAHLWHIVGVGTPIEVV